MNHYNWAFGDQSLLVGDDDNRDFEDYDSFQEQFQMVEPRKNYWNQIPDDQKITDEGIYEGNSRQLVDLDMKKARSFLPLKKKSSTFKSKTKKNRINKASSRRIHSKDSKNIVKNYRKAIIKFIMKERAHIQYLLNCIDSECQYNQFVNYLRTKNDNSGNVQSLKELWNSSSNMYAKQFRVISQNFMRKHCLSYIFNSRITNTPEHLYYRTDIRKGIRQPSSFYLSQSPR